MKTKYKKKKTVETKTRVKMSYFQMEKRKKLYFVNSACLLGHIQTGLNMSTPPPFLEKSEISQP